MTVLRTMSLYAPILSVWIRFFFFGGVLKANGVILSYTVAELRSTNALVAWAFTIQNSLTYLAAPLGGYMMRYLTCRQLSVIGGILIGLGYVFSGIYLTSIWQLYVYYALSGIGFALSSISQCMYIHAHFRDQYVYVFAVAAGFMYVGVAVLPITLQFFINNYGHRGGKACFGALAWNFILGGVLLRPTSKTERLAFKSHLRQIDESDKHFLDRYLWFFSSCLRHRKFGVLVTFAMVAMYVYTSWSIFLISFGEARGLSTLDAVSLSIMGGVGGIAGNATAFMLVRSRRINGYTCCLFPALMTGIIFSLTVQSDDFRLLSILTFATGSVQCFQYGVIMAAIPLIVCDYHLRDALIASSVCEGIILQMGGLISGFIQDYNGSPDMAFVICSVVSFLVVPMSLVWILDRPSINQCYEVDGSENSD